MLACARLFLFLYVFSGLICLQLPSQTVIELKETDHVLIPGKAMGVYEDKTGKLSIEEICKTADQLFLNAKSDIPNFNITTSTIWTRFLFTTKENGPWILEMANASTAYVTFYFRQKDGKVSKRESGFAISNKDKEIQTYHNYTHIPLIPGDTTEVFVSMYDSAPMQAHFKAGHSERFFENDHKTNLFHGIFYGIMMLMVTYNLFLFITNRDKVYLYYVLYMFFNTFFIAFFVGHASLLADEIKQVFLRFPAIVPAAFASFGVFFTMEFLQTKKDLPFMHKVLTGGLVATAAVAITGLLGFTPQSVLAVQLVGMPLSAISIITGILALKRCNRTAKFYLLGYGSYMLSLILFIGTDLEFLPLYKISRYILEIGSITEAVLLSFAIGDKFNISNKEKNKAKEEALRIAWENERLIREQNTMLEQKVQERTRELNLQKAIIEEKNKDIIASIEYAKRIQRSLLPQEKYIIRVLEKLKKN